MVIGLSLGIAGGAKVTADAAVVRRDERTITTVGNAETDATRHQFGLTSIKLDGTGDYLTADLDLPTDVGTGATTWECFFNVDLDAGAGTVAILSSRAAGTSNGEVEMLFRNSDMKVEVNGYGTGAFSAAGVGSALAVDAWHHYVWARDASGNWAIWVNGTRVSNGTGYTQSLTTDSGFGIGASADGNQTANSGTTCWIDEVRVSSADIYGVSNTSITVPTAPFINDVNDTKLLVHAIGIDPTTAFYDDNNSDSRPVVMYDGITAPSISSAQSQFGGSSAVFDGTNDILVTNHPIVPATSEFTIECWARFDDTNIRTIVSQYENGVNGRFLMQRRPSGSLQAFFGGTGQVNIIGTTVINANTWYHLACTRDSSNNFRIFIDGNLEGTANSTIGVQQSEMYLGTREGGSRMDGYIDEFRISSVARYTASFTPSTSAFTNDSDTLLLLHFDTDFADDNS